MVEKHKLVDLIGGFEIRLNSLREREEQCKKAETQIDLERIWARIDEVEGFLQALNAILEETAAISAPKRG